MKIHRLTVFLVVVGLAAGAILSRPALSAPKNQTLATAEEASQSAPKEHAEAVFAGGCFWCIEADFEKLAGVLSVVSGYTGGALDNPTYKDVVTEKTGHYEAIRVSYDPAAVSYRELVDYFYRHVDPLDAGGQFCDRGSSYRTAIFVANDEQQEIAAAATADAEGVLEARIVTQILPLGAFWPAEDYHQDYYKKNRLKYGYYRNACGRDRRVNTLWGKKKA